MLLTTAKSRHPIPTLAIAARPKVLVVVRYSPACRSALRLGARIAAALGAELIVLSVLPMGIQAMGIGGRGRDEERGAIETARLETFVGAVLCGSGDAVPYEAAIAFSLSAHEHIAEIAARRRIDLIVLGDDRGPVRRRLFRGLADRLRAIAPCPILALNRGARSSLFGPASRLAPRFGSRLRPAPPADSGSSSSSRR
jgi:nucleotide-binding universal stress UspA family protein